MSVEIKVDSAAWERQFKEGIRKTLQVAAKIFKEAVEEFQKDVKQSTPIGNPTLWETPAAHDYVPGALRQSWKIDWQDGYKTAFVYNDRPYAYRVETGWSYRQAPNGMMRLAVLDFPNIVDKLSRKYKL
jgi:hypothetical protein